MRERFRQRFCFVIVIIDYFARKRRSKRRVKKRRRRDPPFLLLLHLLPGIKKQKNHRLDPPLSSSRSRALARRAALFSFPTTIFTNSKYSYWCKIPQNQIVLPFFRVRSSREREREKREKRDGSSWRNREKTSVLEKRQPSIGFFFSLLSLRRTSSSRERRREEEEISISFFSNERAFLFYALSPSLLSPLLRELEQSAHRGRRRRRRVSLVISLTPRAAL